MIPWSSQPTPSNLVLTKASQKDIGYSLHSFKDRLDYNESSFQNTKLWQVQFCKKWNYDFFEMFDNFEYFGNFDGDRNDDDRNDGDNHDDDNNMQLLL